MRARSAKMQGEAPERASAEQLGERVEDRDGGKRTKREGEGGLGGARKWKILGK